jgi:hypothetical protein
MLFCLSAASMSPLARSRSAYVETSGILEPTPPPSVRH